MLSFLVSVVLAASPPDGLWSAPRVQAEGEVRALAVRALRTETGRHSATTWARRVFEELRDEGWWSARIEADSSAGELRLRIEAGARARLRALDIRGVDPELAERWRLASGLRISDPFRPREWPHRLRRGLRGLGQDGHLFASATLVHRDIDPATGDVALTLMIRPGPRLRLRRVEILGATTTRPEVLARLSGLRPGRVLRESDLARGRRRLQAREVVEAVDEPQLLRVPGLRDAVDLRWRVVQSPRSGRLAAALGVVDEPEGDGTRISGSVELALLDLFGSARRFEGRWSDDGRSRRRLDLDYLEPLAFGTPLDLRLGLGQRHEDGAYDTLRFDLEGILPPEAARELVLRVGADRTTFLGEVGRLRWRQRLGVVYGRIRARPVARGIYGSLRSSVEAARVRDRSRDPQDDSQTIEASVGQTLLEADGRVGWAFSPTVAWVGHLHWRSTETEVLPLPRSELWSLGGAATVRGYREEQFLGERIAWGGTELVLGPSGAGQAYAFVDLGWVRQTQTGPDGEATDEQWLQGFGLGLRSPTTLGALDLSLGFAESLGLGSGKLHLRLVRAF